MIILTVAAKAGVCVVLSLLQGDSRTPESAVRETDSALAAIEALGAPCKYTLRFENCMLPADDSLTAAFDAALSQGVAAAEFSKLSGLFDVALESRISSGESTEESVGSNLALRIVHALDRTLQWSETIPSLPRVLRARSAEVTYYPTVGKLSFGMPGDGMTLNSPAVVFDPLPIFDRHRRLLRDAEWTWSAWGDRGRCSRVHGVGSQAAAYEMLFNGNAGGLPAACSLKPGGQEIKVLGVFEYRAIGGVITPAGAIHVRRRGGGLYLERFGISEFSHGLVGDDLRLPVGEVRLIEDATGPEVRLIGSMEDIGPDLRSLILLESGAAGFEEDNGEDG